MALGYYEINHCLQILAVKWFEFYVLFLFSGKTHGHTNNTIVSSSSTFYKIKTSVCCLIFYVLNKKLHLV